MTGIEIWEQTVNETAKSLNLELPLDVNNYVVHLLNTKMTTLKPKEVQAEKYLAATTAVERVGIGDNCMLLSGLFPERTQKLNVNDEYFTDMAKACYQTVDNEFYNRLIHEVDDIVKILNNIRI